MSPIGIKELMDIGIGELSDFQKTNVITCATVYIDGNQLITKNIPTVPGMVNYGRVIPRITLDNLILEAARKQGVEIITPCKLKHYTVHENKVTVDCSQDDKELTFSVKLLIGADGSNSTVARIMNGKKPDPEHRIVAVRAYAENVNCIPNQAELYFTSKSFPGYYWFFPTGPTTANLGVGMMLENFPKTEINLKELLLDILENDVALKAKIGNGKLDKIEGWPLSIYNPDATIVKDRILLTGDAAGLINSINGEGIQYALQSGRWAAESVITCLSSDDVSAEALKIFDLRVRREIGFDMSLSNLVLQFIRNRNLNPLWMKVLKIFIAEAKKEERYTTICGGILAGMVPVNKAISFYFIRKTIAQAMVTAFRGPFGIFKFIKHAYIFGWIVISQSFKQRREYWIWMKGIKKAVFASISLRNT